MKMMYSPSALLSVSGEDVGVDITRLDICSFDNKRGPFIYLNMSSGISCQFRSDSE